MDKLNQSISSDVVLGKNVWLGKFINLYGCHIDHGSKIGPFVEIQKNAYVGQKTKIQSHTFICEGVSIGDDCFIGHGVMFINDNHPQSVSGSGQVERDSDWAPRFVKTTIEDKVAIGSNATILGGITIGKGATIGAGSVVTKNVPEKEIWAGNPAKKISATHQSKKGDD